jgi:hypothetical protein
MSTTQTAPITYGNLAQSIAELLTNVHRVLGLRAVDSRPQNGYKVFTEQRDQAARVARIVAGEFGADPESGDFTVAVQPASVPGFDQPGFCCVVMWKR